MLFNLDTVANATMNLQWWDADPNTVQKVSYWATSKQQSDSNWDSSVFIYKATADCVDCNSEVVTLNFRFEVLYSY